VPSLKRPSSTSPSPSIAVPPVLRCSDTVILQAKRQFPPLNHLITVLWYACGRARGLVSLAVSCWGLRGARRQSGGRACKSEGRSGRAEGSALRSGAKTRARKGPVLRGARAVASRAERGRGCVSPPGCSRFCSPRHDSTAATRFGDFTTRPVLLYLERDEWRRARRRELPSVVVCSYTQRPFQLSRS
jgi:hypothetical protein